ncbi:CHAD domain-containing protein [Marinobacterium aestuariivivens]|uniref:CHAD domain-containing protein n=1 Tax=Marinobacterium aestuariivivens TaxID=1698799 RepID=A0ABW2A1C4_9GAMM
MAFRLRPSKPLAKEVRRIARDELKRLKTLMTEPVGDRDEGIHQLRVGMKRMRALLHLIRDALAETEFEAAQARCKALADDYAGARDASVGRIVLEELLQGCHEPEQRERLRNSFQRSLGAVAGEPPPLCEAVTRLKQMRRELKRWPLSNLGLKPLGSRLEKQYRKAARFDRQVRADRAMALMHEWRKVVKRLLYQLELVQGDDKKLLRRLRRLGSLLGDLHDLDMLELQVESHVDLFWLDDRQTLLRLLRQQRENLRSRALRLGDKLFVEDPKSFVRGRFRHWRRAR